MRVLRNPLLGQVSSSEPPWFTTILHKLRFCTQTRTQIQILWQVKKLIFDIYPDVYIFCKCLHLYQLGFCDKRIESIFLEISTKHEIHVGLNVSICPSLGRANRTCVLIPSLPDVLLGDLLCTIHYVNNLNHESCWGKRVQKYFGKNWHKGPLKKGCLLCMTHTTTEKQC